MNSVRWWAPTGPHLGPDEVELAMLAVTGADRRLDLGGVLLAAHRVGDAACQAAAREPICDEGTLVNALAKARGQLADPMVDSVSKCVDEGGSYAGLLVRDVLDAADEATVSLFSAARSRGVAGPLAATRAGAVYGVPAVELGKYRTLAIDPKANPVALSDAADRAVFKYLGELAASETSGEVSKAVAVDDRPEALLGTAPDGTHYFNLRDEHGKWTKTGQVTYDPQTSVFRMKPTIAQPGLLARVRGRYGMGGGAVPEVATGRPSEVAAQDTKLAKPKTEEPKPKLTPAELRRRQQMLRRRGGKAKPAEAQTERPAHQRAQHKRANAQRTINQRKLQQRKIISTKLQQALEREQNERVVTPKELAAAFKAPEANHWLLDTQQTTPQNYHTLDNPVAYVLDVGDARYLNQEAASAPGRLFRIGHLEQLHGGEPEDYTPPEVSGDRSHEANVENTAEQADGQEPIAGIVKADEIPNGNAGKEYLRAQQHEWANETGDFGAEYTSVLPDVSDNGDYWTITQDGDDPPPRVFEYVVHDARGRVEGTGKNWAYQLDPNQAYRMPDPDQWQETYDPDKGIIRVRVHLSPVSELDVTAARKGEYFGKAVATQVRPATDLGTTATGRHYYARRDEHGEFTRGGLMARVPPSNTRLLPSNTVVAAPEQTTRKPLTPAELRRRQQSLKRKRRPQRASQDQPQRASAERTAHRRAVSGRKTFARVQLDNEGRARQQAQAKLTDELMLHQLGTVDAPKLKLDGSHTYRVMDHDEFADMKADNSGLSTLRDGVIRVRANDDLNALDAHNLNAGKVFGELRHAQWDVHTAEDGAETQILSTSQTTTLPEITNFARHVIETTAQGEHGMVVEVPTEINSGWTQLHASKGVMPLYLIEFDPGLDPGTGQGYDLIPMGVQFHQDVSHAEDEYTEDLKHHYYMHVHRYLAVDPSETEAVLRARRKGER